MSALQNAAASVTPPTESSNVFVAAGTASSAARTIPDSWRKGYITLTADGDAFGILFGTSSVAASLTALTTTWAADPTFQGTESVKIVDGGSIQVDGSLLSKDHTHFAIIGTGTAGFLRITRSSGKA